MREVFPDALVAPGLMLAAPTRATSTTSPTQSYRFLPVRVKPEDLARVARHRRTHRRRQLAELVRFYHRLLTQVRSLKPRHRSSCHEPSRHRLHRPHAAGQELEGRLQHDPWRHAGRPCGAGRGRARRHRPRRGRRRADGLRHPEGATGGNIARQIALRAGLPITTSGVTVNRFCSSGLQTIAMAAQRIIAGEGDVYVAGGVESISCVQQEMNQHMLADPALQKHKPEIYWNMLQTAEQVAKRYNVAKERMDHYGAGSQQKACAAQEKGLFNDEIVACTVTAGVADAAAGPAQQGSDDQRRRRPAPGHHLRRHPGHPHGDAGRCGHGRQRQPVQRRCRRLRRDQRELRAAEGTASRWAAFSASRWPAASPTRWASARSSRCPRC